MYTTLWMLQRWTNTSAPKRLDRHGTGGGLHNKCQDWNMCSWKCPTAGLSFRPLAQIDLPVALLAVLKRCTGLADLLLEFVALRLSTTDLNLKCPVSGWCFNSLIHSVSGFESPRYICHFAEVHVGIGWEHQPALMSRWEEPTAGQTCNSWNQQHGQLLEYFLHTSWILSSSHR